MAAPEARVLPAVCFAASASLRGLVDRIADHRVLVAILGTDVAREHRSRRHPDAEVDHGQAAQVRRERPCRGERRGGGDVGSDGRAEHGERGVALKLVDQPTVFVHRSHHDLEEVVEDVGDLRGRAIDGELGGAGQIDEEDRDVAYLAADRLVGLDRPPGHVGSDVPTEEVTQPVSLDQAGDHSVESALQTPDLGLLVDVDGPSDVAVLDVGHRLDDVSHGIGDGTGHQDQRAKPEKHRHGGEHDDRNVQCRRLGDEPAVRPAQDQHRDRDARHARC